MTPRTSLTRIDLTACTDETRHELWRFVARYEEVTKGELAARLRDLSDLYVCRYPSGAIGGVVAAKIAVVNDGGRSFTLVWGEWGFLDPPFRGRLMLERAMLRSVLKELVRRPLHPVYFMAEAATRARGIRRAACSTGASRSGSASPPASAGRSPGATRSTTSTPARTPGSRRGTRCSAWPRCRSRASS